MPSAIKSGAKIAANVAKNKISSNKIINWISGFSTAGAKGLTEAGEALGKAKSGASAIQAVKEILDEGADDLAGAVLGAPGQTNGLFVDAFKGLYQTLQGAGWSQEGLDKLSSLKTGIMGVAKDAGLASDAKQQALSALSQELQGTMQDSVKHLRALGAEGAGKGMHAVGKSAIDFFRPGQGTAQGYGPWLRRVGTYGAANLGLRYLSGGSLTRNARGERDIAGVPFL